MLIKDLSDTARAIAGTKRELEVYLAIATDAGNIICPIVPLHAPIDLYVTLIYKHLVDEDGNELNYVNNLH